MAVKQEALSSGPSSAAVLAAGIGALDFGLVSLIAEVSAGFSNILNWINPVGALSGKTTVGVILWLISWGILGGVWKERDVPLVRSLVIAGILLVLGLLCTFPPFFEMVKGGE